jgi:membrane protein
VIVAASIHLAETEESHLLPSFFNSDASNYLSGRESGAPSMDLSVNRKASLDAKVGVPYGELCRRVWRQIEATNCTGWAAEMSYYFVAALFPFFIFLVALVGFLPFTGFWNEIVDWVVRYLPPDAQRWVLLAVLGLTRGRVPFLSFGVLGTAWGASTGIMSLMDSLNAAYEVRETRSYWKRRALALLLLVVLSVLVIAAFGVSSLGHWVGVRLAVRAGRVVSLNPLWDLGRWVITFLLIGLAAAVTDYALPNLKRPWRWVTPGSVFVILAWLLASKGFNTYVHYVGSYSKTYGALGGLMILMLWIYIVSLIIMVGAEVNSQVDKIRSETRPPSPPRNSTHEEGQTMTDRWNS